MNISDILLEDAVRPIYGYHTTSQSHLKSILKQGLVPNKSSGGYASNATSSSGYNLSALPGVYFFKDADEAETLAKDLSVDKNEPSLVVICKIQPKTATLDEDNLVGKVINETQLYRRLKRAIAEGTLTEQTIQDETANVVAQLKDVLDPRAIKNVEPDIYRYILTFAKFLQEQAPDTEVKALQEVLTNKLRQLLLSKQKNQHDTFKVNQPVSFSGANKIVGIYSPDQRAGWGDLGDFERDAYHKYKTPMQMVRKEAA